MSRKKRGDDTEQLSLFAETEPDWILVDVDTDLRSTGSFKGNPVCGEGQNSAIDEDAADEDLEQFARWLKQKGGEG